ncbi:prostatic acid phosphatase [Naviculisporaceae sp. PSN 640]
MRAVPIIALVGCLTGAAVAETVHGVVIFTRHGDRTTKHYGAQALTSLGAQQNFQVGSSYRSRYLSSSSPHQILDISEFTYVPSQIYATAPGDSGILLNTATAFLQGLYPPIGEENFNKPGSTSTLNNGTDVTSPLNGYQYVVLHGKDSQSPDAIWLKGDDSCPVVAAASESFYQSSEFRTRLASTRDFYQSFSPILDGVYNYKSGDMELSYANAYDIFDLINVARIHNATSPARNVNNDELFQLRTLADSAEFGYNFNASQRVRSTHAQTFLGGVLAQLNQTVRSKGQLKLSLMAGSYDTFLGFFGLANLIDVSGDFYGLPEYASTMAFELFSDQETGSSFPATNPDESLRVRFLFRNGTAGILAPFPLFGKGKESISWAEFVAETKQRAITSPHEWCGICESSLPFCSAAADDAVGTSTAEGSGGTWSNAVAGVIGAVVTLGVVSVIAALVFVVMRKRRGESGAVSRARAGEKGSLHRSISTASSV